MSQEKTHNLHYAMRDEKIKMANNHERIQKLALEDPGTAGDQAEEDWAELLRGWLPRTYKVITKGRIIGADGQTSPQVDVLVLKDIYPKKLHNKKLYLAAGVAAAFECKTTLRAEHIKKAVETSVAIKAMYPIREGTPYKELHAPIVYGLLAHSHSWKGSNSTPEANIEGNLRAADKSHVKHPRQTLDLLCVADLAAWTSFKVTNAAKIADELSNNASAIIRRYLPKIFAMTSYFKHFPFPDEQAEHFTSIGSLIFNLLHLIAWEDSALQPSADYYRRAKLTGDGSGRMRFWEATSVYGEKVSGRISTASDNMRNSPWSEWNWAFPHYSEE